MKNKIEIIIIMLFGYASCIESQTTSNYIISVLPLDATSSITFTETEAVTDGRSLQTIDSFDEDGNLDSRISLKASPTGANIAVGYAYDPYNRMYQQTLPVPMNDIGSVYEIFDAASNYYNDELAYEEILYENSPLDRVLGKKKAGTIFHKHQSNVAYKTNSESEVYSFSVNNGNLYNDGYFSPGKLFRVDNTDEDGKLQSEYKNTYGQIVLTRQYDNGDAFSTYYVYDDFNRLCYVLPPLAADRAVTNGQIPDDKSYMKEYAYIYKYDAMGNCIEKRLPGCEPIVMKYDDANRLIEFEDGNMRAIKICKIFKYDKFSRLTYIGVRDKNSKVWPLIVYYYDNYDFISELDDEEKRNLVYQKKDGYGQKHNSSTGKLTGCRVYALYGPGTYYLAKAYYYDSYGQIIQHHSGNAMGGFDYNFYSYSFSGKVLKQLHIHSDNLTSKPFSETYVNTYDTADRLLMTKYKLGDLNKITLVDNTYDELGRLSKTTSMGRKAYPTTFSYDIHGHITEIGGGYGKRYYYEKPESRFGKPCYNGNISESQTYSGSTVLSNSVYTYDGLNRIVQEDASDGSNTFKASWEFDKMSNITALRRYDKKGKLFDDLTISYNGNQIEKVDDDADNLSQYATKEYQDYSQELSKYGNELVGWDSKLKIAIIPREHQYDSNGNLTTDLDRKIVTIRYNLLNLPDTIQFSNGSQIINRYLADGTKVRTEYITASTDAIIPIGTVCNTRSLPGLAKTEKRFCGNIEHTLNGQGKLSASKIENPEGFFTGTGSNAVGFFYVRDIQGSVIGVIHSKYLCSYQFNDYYADGLLKNNSWGTSVQPDLYIGKEYIPMHGYDAYDFGARHTYSALGRFTSMDPLAEKYYNTSPYVYCAGNPVKYVDPDGRDWITASYDEDIFVFYDERINSAEDIKSVYYYKDGAGGRNSYDIQYIGKPGFYNTNGNELTLNDNGTYSMNGVAHNGEYDNGGLHVGSTRYTDISKDKGVACNNNFYGNYAGGHNPKFSSGLDSYAMPPIDDLDYAAFKHDKGYDEFGAKGGLSAFTDIRVIEVDYKLGYDCLKVSSNGSEYKSSSRNKIVAFSFVVTGIKEMLR